MSGKIFVPHDEVWGMWCATPQVIAVNSDTGITITAESVQYDTISVVVSCDSEEIWEESYDTKQECTDGVDRIYQCHITGFAPDPLLDYRTNPYIHNSGIPDETEEEFRIEERETELSDAAFDFLFTVKPEIEDIADDPGMIAEQLVDCVCEWLFTHHGISVYRPMMLEQPDGSEVFAEHPYEVMNFDE